jgi:pimeloyl-ACP methyl ester carboxylesterase
LKLAMKARLAICLSLAVLLAGCGQSSAQAFRAEVHVARVAGTRIAWYERGQGPPLLMLIGTGSTMAEWDPALLRLLARDHRLILFDYPGLGLSGPWQGSSFDSLAGVTAGLMSAIHLPRADLLGWSMGGFVAQRLAIDHPGRVSHLILAGTNPGGSHAVLGTPKAQAIDSEPHPSDADILHELYPPGRQAEGRRFLRRLERASQSGEIPDDFHVPAATTRRQVAAEDPWLRSSRNYRQLAGIAAPTLAAAGAEDPVVPPVNLRRIAARIPRSRLVVFPGAHAFLFQERRPFTRAVNRFCFGRRRQQMSELRNGGSFAAQRAKRAELVVRAGAVPDVEVDGLDRELHQARSGEEVEDELEGVVFGDAGVDGLLAAEAGGQLERLAAVLAERAEGAHEEVAVGDRLTELQRAVPGGKHREVVLVELRERFRVVGLELVVGDLVDPGADRLAEQLATRLAADRVGDCADRVGGVYEAEGHSMRSI